jgi:hypothetical protein
MIINSGDDMYWKVNNKIFYSKILAMDEAHLSGKKIEFHFYDNWLTNNMSDPTDFMSWDNVLLDRVMEIREKWPKIRLWYSGGRDSHLALQTFIKNKIPIDELVVIDFHYRYAEYPYIYKSLISRKEELRDIIKEITCREFDSKSQKDIFGKNWHLENENTVFTALPPISRMINYFYEADKNWCNITGAEKPRVMCFDGKMYSSMNDGTPQTLIGIWNHEPFYISKNVPIFQYQTWSLVNYILRTPELKNYSDHELNMGLNTIPKNPWNLNSLYYHGCRGALRTEFANYELGLPFGKAFQVEYATKIGLVRYNDLEETWKNHYPEIHKAFRNGMLSMDENYESYHQNSNVSLQPLKIHSKRHFLKDRIP